MSQPEINVLTGQPISDGELGQIAKLAGRLLQLQSEIELAEQQLEQMNEQYRTLSEQTLPEAMMAVGLASFKVTTGRQLIVDKFYSCGLPKREDPLRGKAFSWLTDNGHGGLIKTKITTEFGRGEEKLVANASRVLTKAQIPFQLDQDVHAMTLKSFVREQYEAGHSVPTDLFRVFIGNRIKVK